MLPIGYESQGPPSKRVKELQTHSLPKIASRMVLMGSKEVGENVEESELIEVPVEILLSCVSFAKQYQMADFCPCCYITLRMGWSRRVSML